MKSDANVEDKKKIVLDDDFYSQLASDNYYLPRGELSAEDVSHYNNIEERLFYYEK